MKKILFSLVALVASMSMNAQIMKVMKDGVEVAKYNGAEYSVVFEEEPASTTTGTAKRSGNINVNWVQLWADGPKFAEYNVGAANNKAEDCGGYYAWGGSQDKVDDHNTGTVALTRDADTATKLWGSNWRMPKKEEFDALLTNCVAEWTNNYNGTHVKGIIFKGKNEYSSNSVFLPAAGLCSEGEVDSQGEGGLYRSSTPDSNGLAYCLVFMPGNQDVHSDFHILGLSVRAVLAE